MYRSGHYKTKIFKDNYELGRAEEQLETFLNHLSDDCCDNRQDFQIKNISMSVDNNGRTTILFVWKYV